MKTLDTESSKYIITLLTNLLIQGEKIKAIQLLKNLKNVQKVDITYLIDQVLPFGDIVFYLFVKNESLDLLNSFHAYDKYLHTIETQLILDMFKFNIIAPEYSAKINSVSLEKAIYMIIQFTEYNEVVIEYLFEKYSGVVSYMGLLEHMIYYNMCHDIFIYINACNQDDRVVEKLLKFEHILESYQEMYNKHKDDQKYNKCLRSRLIGLTQLISNLCRDKQLEMPTYKNYKQTFEKYYQINCNDHTSKTQEKIKNLLDKVCLESYNYVNDAVPWGSQRWTGINDA